MGVTASPDAMGDRDFRRATRRALGVVAVLNFAYGVAAASPYAIACLPRDAGTASFATAAGVILLEVFAVSLPGYLAGMVFWRAGWRRMTVWACLAWLVFGGALLRADAVMFPLFRQHAYGALALGCLLEGDPNALAMTPAQMALYIGEGLLLVGLQAPAFLLVRRALLRNWPERSARWVRPAVAGCGAALFLLALGAWATSRTSGMKQGMAPESRRPELMTMQRGMLVPLAGEKKAPPPPEVAAAAARGFSKALATAAARPKWMEPLEITAAPAKKPNIVIIFAESLRADEFTPESMPEMWRFAEGSTRAANHCSNGNTTYLALFSLAYGQSPAGWDLALAAGATPPPLEALRKSGYRLHVASGCSMAWWRLDDLVLPRAMMTSFVEHEGRPVEDDLAATAEAERVIESSGSEPFALMVFLYSTHWSYYFPPECTRFTPFIENIELKIGPDLVPNRAQVRNRYRNAAFFLDRSAGRILRKLESRVMMDNTVVVFAGDHGESFQETGSFCHGGGLPAQEIRVPLAVRWPGAAPREIQGFTQHDDIFPSIFGYMGLRSPQIDALTGRPHLLEGTGRAFYATGAGEVGSPRQWVLGDAKGRLYTTFPGSEARLEVLGWRSAEGWEGEPLAGKPGADEAAGIEERVRLWAESSGAAAARQLAAREDEARRAWSRPAIVVCLAAAGVIGVFAVLWVLRRKRKG